MAELKHFLDLDLIDTAELRRMLDMGRSYKAKDGVSKPQPLAGKTLAMIFEKPSTRTRVSFEVAMKQLGGDVVILNQSDSQLGRGEPIADTARVLSRYVDVIMMRTAEQSKLEELATYATVPVINGLTDQSHPCQIMADLLTLEEHRGALKDQKVAWSGDGNNVVASWIHAAVKFDFELRIATPAQLRPAPELLDWAKSCGRNVHVTLDPEEAVRDVDCVVTDTWVSMGVEASTHRHNLLAPYRIDERLMKLAKSDAIFMHCLPAHRGEEVSAAVIDGPQSVVWDEAENRLHAQKGILAWCLA